MTANNDKESETPIGELLLSILGSLAKKLVYAFVFVIWIHIVLRLGGTLLGVKALVDATSSELFRLSLLIGAMFAVYRSNYPRRT